MWSHSLELEKTIRKTATWSFLTFLRLNDMKNKFWQTRLLCCSRKPCHRIAHYPSLVAWLKIHDIVMGEA